MAEFKRLVERRLIISSRVAEGYILNETARKNLQHVLTVYFPKAVFFDLTDDTVRVDIEIKVGTISGRNMLNTSFLNADGSLIKRIEYDEDRIKGKVCEHYEQSRSGYYGNKDGIDYRVVFYMVPAPPPPVRRP